MGGHDMPDRMLVVVIDHFRHAGGAGGEIQDHAVIAVCQCISLGLRPDRPAGGELRVQIQPSVRNAGIIIGIVQGRMAMAFASGKTMAVRSTVVHSGRASQMASTTSLSEMLMIILEEEALQR